MARRAPSAAALLASRLCKTGGWGESGHSCQSVLIEQNRNHLKVQICFLLPVLLSGNGKICIFTEIQFPLQRTIRFMDQFAV